LLEKYGFPFCFDVTADEQVCHLILSPEGDGRVAERIDRLLAIAPDISGWKVYGRRRRKDLQDVRAIVGQLFLLDPLLFRFRHSVSGPKHRIEIYIPESSDLTPEEQKGLADTFLWHAIGEDVVMKRGIRGNVQFGVPRERESLSASELVRQILADEADI
jgi:hypothetical protein